MASGSRTFFALSTVGPSMKLFVAVMLATVYLIVPTASARSTVPCSLPGDWPHTADANWLARALTRAGFSSSSCTGSAFIVDLGGASPAFTGQTYVWAIHGPAVTQTSRGPLGFGHISSVRIAGVLVRYDRLRGVWHTRGRNVWVESASSQPLLPAYRWAKIVRATLTTPG